MKCNNCGKEMTDEKGTTVSGIKIIAFSDHPEAIRFKQRYGVDELNICLVCLAQALGMRRSTYTNQT